MRKKKNITAPTKEAELVVELVKEVEKLPESAKTAILWYARGMRAMSKEVKV